MELCTLPTPTKIFVRTSLLSPLIESITPLIRPPPPPLTKRGNISKVICSESKVSYEYDYNFASNH